MAKYYRNGRPIAEEDLPPRTLKHEPNGLWLIRNAERIVVYANGT